ncbi:MAG: DNRLRE domain-containing protein [Halioglobus sp.]|nr:DNRLRE domain-containing protein [Halioglobus sp.]
MAQQTARRSPVRENSILSYTMGLLVVFWVASVALLPSIAAANSQLQPIIDSMPANSWKRVNLNYISDVFTPERQQPSATLGTEGIWPGYIITAWGAAAWDSNRGDLIVFGGEGSSVCCWAGNDVYRWRSSTLLWERASLPSELRLDEDSRPFAVDGPEFAPTAGESYDSIAFLPMVDRMVVFGIATNGFESSSREGPYFWDPSKAHPDAVGGTAGTQVRPDEFPDVTAGLMWENRDNPQVNRLPGMVWGSTTDVSVIDGKDVVFYSVNAGGPDTPYPGSLMTYTVNSLDPTEDEWELLGKYGGYGGAGTGAYAHDREIYLVAKSNALLYWDTSTPGPTNPNIKINYTIVGDTEFNVLNPGVGVAYDQVRGDFIFWNGDATIWRLTPPDVLGPDGWLLEKINPGGDTPIDATPNGIWGKFYYMPNEDAFVGVANGHTGDIWVYKPAEHDTPTMSISTQSLPAAIQGESYEFQLQAANGMGMVSWSIVGGSLPAGMTLSTSGLLSGIPTQQGMFSVQLEATDQLNASARRVLGFTINTPPQIAIESPVEGGYYRVGEPFQLVAHADDTQDGKLDAAVVWRSSLDGVLGTGGSVQVTLLTVGTHQLVAEVTDSGGLQASAVLSIELVAPEPTTTVELRTGLNGYEGATDVYLSSSLADYGFGADTTLADGDPPPWGGTATASMVRFEVFASEGGPVPDGARLRSATLSLYKYSYYDQGYDLHAILVPWQEAEATWNQREEGIPWTQSGAAGFGSDISSAAVASGAVGWEPGWLRFDITAPLQAISYGDDHNYGWRLRGVSGAGNHRYFYSREYAGDAMLRPVLSVTYYSSDAVPDVDGDGVADSIDNCPSIPNPDQVNFDDADDGGDACDTDDDNDGWLDEDDNCPKIANPNQENTNGGPRGDACVILPPGC